MSIEKTRFRGLYIFTPKIFEDNRGYFFESFNANQWKEVGETHVFVQDNESKSKFGTIRGLHYQTVPFAQSKLVRVTHGEIMDVAVDLRKDEPTYGQIFTAILSELNRRQVLIPKGFAHGFSTLSRRAVVNYKCDNFYSKDHEHGINPLDDTLGIDWGLPSSSYILSAKDANQPSWANHIPFSL